jgi:hypothetical protein
MAHTRHMAGTPVSLPFYVSRAGSS